MVMKVQNGQTPCQRMDFFKNGFVVDQRRCKSHSRRRESYIQQQHLITNYFVRHLGYPPPSTPSFILLRARVRMRRYELNAGLMLMGYHSPGSSFTSCIAPFRPRRRTFASDSRSGRQKLCTHRLHGGLSHLHSLRTWKKLPRGFLLYLRRSSRLNLRAHIYLILAPSHTLMSCTKSILRPMSVVKHLHIFIHAPTYDLIRILDRGGYKGPVLTSTVLTVSAVCVMCTLRSPDPL